MDKFKDKKVAIIGFGIEGESVVSFMLSCGARVSVFDVRSEDKFEHEQIGHFKERGVQFQFDKYPENFSGFDLIVRSPGISRFSSVIEKIKGEKIAVTSATKIFFDLAPCPIIGVTGTKGKGTTCSLIYEMLKRQGLDAYLGGNIGVSSLDFLGSLKSDSWVVLELSSFQLADLTKSPKIAVVLMLTSEHLDYHRDIREYIDAKRNILRFQKTSDFAIVNRDYPASNESDVHTQAQAYYVSRERDAEQGCFINDGWVVLRILGKLGKSDNQKVRESENQRLRDTESSEFSELRVIPTADILLPGKHNFENACAAAMAAYLAGVDIKNIAAVLRKFKGLEHRLEFVRIFNGVKYYDDSFSTTPETARAAIEAFENNEILILGGSSKNSDFSSLGKTIQEAKNIKAIIGIGDEWGRIKSSIQHPASSIRYIEECKNMEEIVQKAREIAEVGDVVLLSPACASFDMFVNYKDRGDQFKRFVNSLQ